MKQNDFYRKIFINVRVSFFVSFIVVVETAATATVTLIRAGVANIIVAAVVCLLIVVKFCIAYSCLHTHTLILMYTNEL